MGIDMKKDEEDPVLKSIVERLEKKFADPAFWEKPKKKRSIYDAPRNYKFTEDELKKFPNQYDEYVAIQKDAIRIVKKYINKFQNKSGSELLVKDLKLGLSILEDGLKSDLDRGPEGLLSILERYHRVPAKGMPVKGVKYRPGLGLSRGFGEFLRALPPEDKYWADEIMDAVHKIEDYFRNM